MALTGVNIMYDVEHYDPGDNFNTATSEYRAPLDGHYLIASHLMSDEHEASQAIQVNGVNLLHDHMFDHDEAHVVTEPTIVLRLNTGDILSIQHSFAFGGDILGLTDGGLMRTWLSVALLHTE